MNPRHKMAEESGLLKFATKVGIVCTALLALGTLLQIVSTFLVGLALKPIHDEIREERIARQFSDSLLVNQVAFLAQAIREPVGSAARERAARAVTLAPYRLEEAKQHIEGSGH